jgi:uncharacterized protein YqjF (DUF2071 family)
MRIDPQPPVVPRVRLNAQTWESLSLLHWSVPTDAVQPWLPRGLMVDTVEGAEDRTWISVVPFVMSDVRVPPLPAVGRLSTFPELNLRVYVQDQSGHRGVWFLSLWCQSLMFVTATRAIGFPYHYATGRVGGAPTRLDYHFLRSHSRHRNSARGIEFRATIRAGEPVDASSGVEAWLTARWHAFALRGGRLWRYPVHHEPWSLRDATVDHVSTNILDRFGILPQAAPQRVHIAEPVHALFGPPVLVR